MDRGAGGDRPPGSLYQGEKGDQGPVGPAGPAGSVGPAGSTGPAGADGQTSLVSTGVEPAGTNCATGGARVDVGLDTNGNGVLDASEINTTLTRYLCNGAVGPTGATGATGAAGANGRDTLVTTTVEAVGSNCATGGVRVEVGLDANGNGTLDPAEIDALLTQYVCNGAQGPQGPIGATGASGQNTLVATASEPPGANCATGGARVDYGLDANGNGVLDPAEVNAALRRYTCNGAQGPQGPIGATGATGATGPQGVPGPAGATGPQGAPGILGAYGDGSAGALNIATNTDWTTTFSGANLQFTDITVATGVMLVVPSGTILRATGNVTINGAILVTQGAVDNGTFRPHPGVGLGAASNPQQGIGLSQTAAARLVKLPEYGGGAGARNATCTGGGGGGSFAIYARGTLSVPLGGSITASGLPSINPATGTVGVPGGGGGGGGLIVLMGKTSVSVAGTLQAAGGNGSPGFDGNLGNAEGGGGGGGGGIILLLSSTAPTVTGTIGVSGGSAGANAGASATINAGGGGGGAGGNGGSGGSTTTTPTAGSAGYLIQSTLPTPEALLL